MLSLKCSEDTGNPFKNYKAYLIIPDAPTFDKEKNHTVFVKYVTSHFPIKKQGLSEKGSLILHFLGEFNRMGV
jgi:hypothetical protein